MTNPWPFPVRIPTEADLAQQALQVARPAPKPEPTGWRLVEAGRPPEDEPVWLWEDGRGAWIGTFARDSDGWCFTNCYGRAHQLADGTWDTFDAEWDDDYQPTHWMPLPGRPA